MWVRNMTQQTQPEIMTEYIYGGGLTGAHPTRHEAIGAEAVRARESGQAPERFTERVEPTVRPSGPLYDDPWLTDAHDAEIGMELLNLTNAGVVERYKITDVAECPLDGLEEYDTVDDVEKALSAEEIELTRLIEYAPEDDRRETVTAKEVNESPDMVVV